MGAGRLMSVALTEDQVRAEIKTVTRRLGWWTDKNGRRMLRAGDRLQLCRKVMGRRPGEPLERIATVVVTSVTRERLCAITDEEVAREGFPDWDRTRFVEFFMAEMRCTRVAWVTRIEWRYTKATRCEWCREPLEPEDMAGWKSHTSTFHRDHPGYIEGAYSVGFAPFEDD